MNENMSSTLRRRPIVTVLGLFFITTLGTSLHFLFELSGEWPPMALFAAVNESVWEHLKMAFWPGLLWSALTAHLFGGWSDWRYWGCRGLSLMVPPIMIVVLFYGYTAILGTHSLIADVIVFYVAVTLGQIAFYFIIKQGNNLVQTLRVGVGLLIASVILFSTLSYFPLPFGMFIDPVSGLSGIIEHHD